MSSICCHIDAGRETRTSSLDRSFSFLAPNWQAQDGRSADLDLWKADMKQKVICATFIHHQQITSQDLHHWHSGFLIQKEEDVKSETKLLALTTKILDSFCQNFKRWNLLIYKRRGKINGYGTVYA